MPARVEGLPTQRARWPAGREHPAGPVDERPRRGRGQPHPQPVQVVVGLFVLFVFGQLGAGAAQLNLDLGLAGRDRLDHHGRGVDVVRQAQCAHPELLVDRGVQGLVVGQSRRGLGQLGPEPPVRLGQQLLELFGQQRHLHLLQRDADQPAAATRLEKERPLPRRTHGPSDEPLRRLEGVHLVGHT
ncbi:hypothetical protein Prum_082090 [Phytohabitans rumicis]|uniref:Uncharacterized protein n=1 Tax=Phytohabitans rumicis TaxID=1076125 RepID=A0A6V8LKG9_9ACTN|nr:hypothetical protein Prum_082090 [Phytohabitans rumicis]